MYLCRACRIQYDDMALLHWLLCLLHQVRVKLETKSDDKKNKKINRTCTYVVPVVSSTMAWYYCIGYSAYFIREAIH